MQDARLPVTDARLFLLPEGSNNLKKTNSPGLTPNLCAAPPYTQLQGLGFLGLEHYWLCGTTAPGLAKHFVPTCLGRQLVMGWSGRFCLAIKGGKCFWVCYAKLLSARWRQNSCCLMAHYLHLAPHLKLSVNPSLEEGL